MSLSPLLLTVDLQLVCPLCCVTDSLISYRLKPVQHQCGRSVLLCRTKGDTRWRPVSKRPAFPNPKQYEVCWFFDEILGCTQHQNRCTFARSSEEAAVWMFERREGLNLMKLCSLVARAETGPAQQNQAEPGPAQQNQAEPGPAQQNQAEPGPAQQNQAEPLGQLLAEVDMKVVCDLCSVRQKDNTYSLQSVVHRCGRKVLIAKGKGSDRWTPISERPTGGHMGPSVQYKVCHYFVEGSGCPQHTPTCSYAKSDQEVAVWNFVRERKLDRAGLMRLIAESESADIKPEPAAHSILQQFSGEFMELCKICFHERPQKLTGKRWSDSCAADAAHTWDPVLIHHLSDSRKDVYSQVRPLPPKCLFKYCSHVRQGKPCWHQAGHCQAAQSEVEMAVWKAEHSGLFVRTHLLQLSRAELTPSRQVTRYCKVCFLVLSSPESFYKHCSSVGHAQLLAEDTTTRWRGRQPPHGRRAEFWICDRPQTCEYGVKCPKAHSEEELQEWMMRSAEEQQIRRSMEDQGLMSYSQRLLDEYKNCSDEVNLMSEHVDDVIVSCDEDVSVMCEKTNEMLKWNFHVETERTLVHVALLKQEPGASFFLGDSPSDPCIYSPGERFLTEDTTYTIPLSFISIHPGRYQQWLVMDFDIRPVLLKKLQVRVGQLSCDDPSEPTVNHGTTFQPAERWHRGNRVIIPCSSRTEEEEQLLNNYKPPQINFLFTSSSSDHKPLNKDNYRERMHRFLYDEEQAEDRLVSRLNVCGEVSTQDILSSPQSGMDVSPRGHLFCVVPTRCPLTVDSPEGQVLKWSVHCGLIAPSPSSGPKVYEASMLRTTENQMFLLLSKQCCSDLSLRANGSYQMEVQFQLDRHSFCTLHKAVDLLPDTRRVLPDLHNCAVPVSDVLYEKLNTKQQSAVHFITGRSGAQQFVAPLLIYGPFGTGKTLTLATAARELIKQPHNKVLICTHTNSSADLYVRDHFHPFISGDNDSLKPLRIKANKHGTAVSATDKVTLKYCFRSEDGTSFLPPTKAALDRHNVVITTTTMAQHVQELQLAEGFFSHILIDEASQMLECEALMALGLGGPNTRLVLAGDHMQMGPKLFSVEDDQRSHHTLLTRLFHLYQGQRCEAALSSRIIFSENYRSTAEIVHFVSTNFYVGKNDVIKASGNIPAPADGHALKFTHVRGECLLDTASMSWYNRQEVDAVIEAVKDVLERWPPTWGLKDQTSVCVLSEGVQVRRIRAALSKKSFSRVNVENLANVQGKQFRAVVMTAVQTRDSLNTSHLAGLELFNDARVLNTAMTRAQSQVLVVGDAAALCCFGKCSGIWKSFIDHCISSGSAAPQHFTKQFFERDVLETTRFQRPQHVEETLTASDAILQELEDEYEQLKEKYSCDEEESEDQNQNRSRACHADGGVSELLRKQPHNFQQGTMFRESFKRGYVVPFHDPSKHIAIKGRENLGKAFTGDEVVLQTARVVNITRKEESARVLVCQLEDEDHSKPRRPNCNSKFIKRMMIPLTRTEPKICILILKRRRHFLPIWRQVEGRWEREGEERLKENLRLNYVFIVQVISWRESCFYPLGYVLRVLPVAASLMSGLQILNEEFKVTHNTCRSVKAASLTDEDEDETLRLDLRDIITFTVDPNGAEDLDDAISVREDGDRYELGVHIADVASFVSPDGELDREAKQHGSSFYPGRQRPVHMFPQDLSTGHFSLRAGAERRVVSLMFTVDKDTQRVVEAPKFQLSLITSDRQLTYEEAEVFISDRYQQRCRFESVPDCVAAAYCFAKAQRKARLADWAYSQPDDKRVAGKRKAHLMIEELSVLFNKHASETLIDSPKTRYHTPLRCQAAPERLQEFQERCGDLIPFSFYLRHRFHHDNQSPSCETFRVLTEVWRDIQSAAREGDTDKMVDLVAADDLHPLLQPVMEQFRRCYSKAYVTRSKSGHKAEVGHYSLNLPSYTYASSPIRRYMDIILQRLLHAVIRDGSVRYSRTDISTLCSQFEQTFKKTKEYEQKAEQMFYAVSLKKQSSSKLAFVVGVEPEEDGFSVSFPFNKNIFSVSLSITYKDLQLEDQPVYDKEHRSICLRWRRRIYAADAMPIHQQLKQMSDRGPCSEIPLTTWRAIVEAIDGDKLDDAKSLILEAKPKQLERPTAAPESPAVPAGPTESFEEQSEHWVDIQHPLQPGDTLHMQMTSEVRRGYHVPAVQLLHIKPKFEICVEHVHSPITCFSTSADDPTRIQYSNMQEYIRIWKPLCDMESAATAVDESDGIIIENLVVAFSRGQEGTLTGNFFLPVEWTERWAIECDLAKCFLCIRRRGLKLSPTLEHSTAVDPTTFTWVAHCVTTTAQPRNQNGHQVNFFVRHLAMETIPECVFQRNTRFTVEIIPKLLPNIRKESAVVNITSACELVQSVALGQRIPREVQAEWHVVRGELDGLPNLNPSQHRAVDKALHSTFTLIQGPPGTGKTVVGVHIVFRFFQQNSQNLRKVSDPKDKNKQQVILYCGPSNKSVDVVAEYLMRFKDRLRPLRVYSQQVEMLDYPFPDPTLQFSQRTLRQDRSKQELRSITLHHRMRQDHNIFSEPIKAFDERIKLAREKKGPQLMASEVKIYKKLLRDAREFELRQHDIILCTCTQASTPSLTKTVSARQILIDECAMATEPQAMIPLVCNKPEKIVLIGDHKQLRPIVRNERVKKLGMAKSLFERYYNMHESRTVMLETQYRMHEDICEFPSNEFYDGKLETGVQQPASVLRVDGRTVSIVFGNVKGKTVSLVVSTNKGNENSKANQEERDRVVAVAQQLVQTANIDQQSIVILSPYNAQVSEIRDELKKKKLNNVGVNTITKSQGSEWRYVLISTVCSLPTEEIETEPDRAWLSKHLGFVGDANQINVAITRAKEGLCIIGDQQLLSCSPTWQHVLNHYRLQRCVIEAQHISVQRVS